MKLFVTTVCYILISTGLGFNTVHAEPIYSLRGNVDLDELSEVVPNRRSMAVNGGIDVSFEDQPPMIPHAIDKTRISLHENSCLSCHNRKDSKIENSPRPPKSHYKTRKGTKLKKISTGRYFCTQCHAPQANKEPLVENTFTN
jgi:cytochrome c-type protein NapB